MARILLDGAEILVSEDLDEVLGRLVAARDGIRQGNGTVTAPSGWMTLTESISGEQLYVQTLRLGYVRGD